MGELAEAVGCHKSTLSKIERGLLVPRGDLMARITAWAENRRRAYGTRRVKPLTWNFPNRDAS